MGCQGENRGADKKMGILKDYEDLPWSHPLRRLAEFRHAEEKLPGGDALFCQRMGISQGKKNDWYHRPELIRYGHLILAIIRMGLSWKEGVYVLVGCVPEDVEQLLANCGHKGISLKTDDLFYSCTETTSPEVFFHDMEELHLRRASQVDAKRSGLKLAPSPKKKEKK